MEGPTLADILKTLLSEEGTVEDPEKVDRIIEYLIDNDIPIDVKIAGGSSLGVGVNKDPKIISDVVEKLGLSEDNIDAYMNKALQKIATILSQKLFHDKEPETEVEKKVIQKLYNKDLKAKVTLKRIHILPIYENSKVVKISVDAGNTLVQCYALSFEYDPEGQGKLRSFTIALTKEELTKLLQQIKEVVNNESEG